MHARDLPVAKEEKINSFLTSRSCHSVCPRLETSRVMVAAG